MTRPSDLPDWSIFSLPRGDEFSRALAKACREYRAGRSAECGDGGARGLTAAMLAVVTYLRKFRPDVHDDLLPLIQAGAIFADRRDGCSDVLLTWLAQPKDAHGNSLTEGRPPESSGQSIAKEIVAAAVSILQDAGETRPISSAYVAKRLDHVGVHYSPSTIRKWQTVVRGELLKGGAEVYQHVLGQWQSRLPGVSAKAFVDGVIDSDIAVLFAKSTAP